MKQDMTSADVAAIVSELSAGPRSLIDAKILKIYQTTDAEIRINLFCHGRGKENLVIESGKRLHLSRYLKESPKIPQPFPMLLRKYISGGRITKIEQHEFDRIVKIRMVRGGEETVLVAELFSKGNIVLLDADGKIILPLKPITFKDRRIRSGEIYELPGGHINPIRTPEKTAEIFASSDKEAVRVLANNFNMGGMYAEEVFAMSGVDKSKRACDITADENEQIKEAMKKLFGPIDAGTFEPMLVLRSVSGAVLPEMRPIGSSPAGTTSGPADEAADTVADTVADAVVDTVADTAADAAVDTAADTASDTVDAAAYVSPSAPDHDIPLPEKETDDSEKEDDNSERPDAPLFTLPEGFEIVDVIPASLARYQDLPKVPFVFFSDALDEVFGKTSLTEVREKEKEKAVRRDKKTGIFERRLEQQKATIEKFDREIAKNTAVAEAIYAEYQFVEDIITVLVRSREKFTWSEIIDILKKAKKEKTNKVAEAIIQVMPADATVVVDLNGTRADIDIRKTVPQNANVYYDLAKKFQKKKEGAEKAIEDTLLCIEKKEKESHRSHSGFTLRVKKHWYDRFRWFISSDGFLVVGGRDADTNEELFKKYIEKRDLVLHTQAPGSPLTVIRSEGRTIPESTILEAASFVTSYSSVWKAGSASADCYVVRPDQVSKTPETGEYLKKGSFVIRGERRYIENIPLEAAVGLELKEETRVIGGPISAVKARGKVIFEIVPGKFNQNDLSKKMYRLYQNEIKDAKFLKAIASPDRIAMMMPPGESDIRTGPYDCLSEDGKNESEKNKA